MRGDLGKGGRNPRAHGIVIRNICNKYTHKEILTNESIHGIWENNTLVYLFSDLLFKTKSKVTFWILSLTSFHFQKMNRCIHIHQNKEIYEKWEEVQLAKFITGKGRLVDLSRLSQYKKKCLVRTQSKNFPLGNGL